MLRLRIIEKKFTRKDGMVSCQVMVMPTIDGKDAGTVYPLLYLNNSPTLRNSYTMELNGERVRAVEPDEYEEPVAVDESGIPMDKSGEAVESVEPEKVPDPLIFLPLVVILQRLPKLFLPLLCLCLKQVLAEPAAVSEH